MTSVWPEAVSVVVTILPVTSSRALLQSSSDYAPRTIREALREPWQS